MHEVEVKLFTMHLGGRRRVLYWAILKLVLQETCVSAFCTFMVKYAAFQEMSFIFPKNAIWDWHL